MGGLSAVCARCGQAACRTEPADAYCPDITALTYSRVMRAMLEIGISFGQTASHSPSLEQLPNPSASACSTIAATRRRRSGLPCGSIASCEILALTKRCADAFLHAATHAPQPMHAAESM